MKKYFIEKNTLIPAPVTDTWKFFSDPRNLARITPPGMKFKILTPDLAENIFSGMLIQYSVIPLLGIRMKWLTEIKDVKKPFEFTDVQQKGPYALWVHRHSFTKHEKGTLMKDEVEYALPLSFIGQIANSILIRKKLRLIFDYREKVIEEIFHKK